jgi:alkylhydroperoxidase family enzyme
VASGARLAVPPVADRGLLFRGVSRLSGLLGRPQLPNIFPVFNINRRLFWAWLFFASRLMPFGRLPAPLREKIILRVAWNCRSRYEWAQHLQLAQSVGVSDAEILSLTLPAVEVADAYLAALLSACDSLCRKQPVDEVSWQQLAGRHSEKELVEILVLIGHYEMVAGLLVNAAVPLEQGIEQNFYHFQERMVG